MLAQGGDAQQQQTPFTLQDGYRSNAYVTISVRNNTRITCEALKNMSSTELTKLWKVSAFSLQFDVQHHALPALLSSNFMLTIASVSTVMLA